MLGPQFRHYRKASMEPATDSTIYIPEEVVDAVTNGIQYSDQRGWIRWAWSALVRAGDVPRELDEYDGDYASHIITFAALGFLHERFHDIYAGTEGDDELSMQLMGRDRPYITDVDVARYSERHGYASLEDLETGEGLLQEAAVNRRVDVNFRLREILGDGRLFTSMVVSGWPEPFPELDEDGEEVRVELPTNPVAEDSFDSYVADVTSNVSSEHMRAYEWLNGNLDLDRSEQSLA